MSTTSRNPSACSGQEGAKAQIIVVTKMRALSPVDGRRLKSFMWRWRVMRGGEIVAGGFCATRRDALNDARIEAEARA